MIDKDFYRDVLRGGLDGVLNRQYLSPSQRRHLQYFLIGYRSITDSSLRDMLNTQDLSQQQIADLLWLLQMIDDTSHNNDKRGLIQNVLAEFEGYYRIGVFGASAIAVRDANQITSYRGEMLLRQIGHYADNTLDYVRLNLYVHEAHEAVNRHALALYRARVARKVLERFVEMDFVYQPNASPHLRELYIQARLAETSAMRNLANLQKTTLQSRVLDETREVLMLLDKNSLGEVEHPDMWRLYLLRDEIRTLSRTSRCTVGDIDALYGRSQAILSKNPQYGDNHMIWYMQIESEVKGFLRTRSKRDGIRMALERARNLPVEAIDTLQVGLSNQVTILRALAMLSYKTNESEMVKPTLERAYQMAREAGLIYKLTLIDGDFRLFGLK